MSNIFFLKIFVVLRSILCLRFVDHMQSHSFTDIISLPNHKIFVPGLLSCCFRTLQYYEKCYLVACFISKYFYMISHIRRVFFKFLSLNYSLKSCCVPEINRYQLCRYCISRPFTFQRLNNPFAIKKGRSIFKGIVFSNKELKVYLI